MLYFSADTTDLEAMKAAAEKARAAHDGVIDILVANAGITHPAAIEDVRNRPFFFASLPQSNRVNHLPLSSLPM